MYRHSFPIVVFSHLRWDFVYQRPQQLLSRLARKRRTLFVEEPLDAGDRPDGWELSTRDPGILVARPRLSHLSGRSAEDVGSTTARLVRDLVQAEGVTDPIAWVYTPMAEPLLDVIEPSLVVYDCMDELTMFLGAPPELAGLEAQLLRRSDLVFTGGRSLYEAKRRRHPRVSCFPSSVDAAHFGQARPGGDVIAEPAEQAALARPRLGYFGVLDERLDLGVLEAIASAHPEWQIVMVGPTVKIDPATLPRRPNIHYMGQQSYDRLPAYLSGWDVCLLPFARNDATRFISPTKTLEYMAAERPIVGTPIADVVNAYSHIVYVAESPDAFVAGCEQALAASPEERAARTAAAREVLARTSWDETVACMERLIEDTLSARARTNVAALQERSVLVIGAGPTGLSAASHLGADATLGEQSDRVGGWCRSLEDRGFTFDYAGHIMFSKDAYVHELYQLLLGDNMHWQDREAWIYSHGTYTRYPFQGALYGLPPAVIKECIVGAIEARFGALKQDRYTGSDRRGALVKRLRYGGRDRRRTSDGEPRNFEEFIHKVWGAGIG